ncbi:MAG: hypothetical protein AAFX44_13600 [Pseudomonadota bacterium]
MTREKPQLAGIVVIAFVVSPVAAQTLGGDRPVMRIPEVRPELVFDEGEFDDVSVDEITVEQMARCVGSDYDIQGRYLELERAKQRLQDLQTTLDAAVERFDTDALAMQNRRTELFADQASVNAEYDALERRREAISNLSAGSSSTDEQALIDEFNADTRTYNARVDAVRAQIVQFNLDVDKYNRAGDRFDAAVDEYRYRQTKYNERVEAFNTKVGRYERKCGGTRRIVDD